MPGSEIFPRGFLLNFEYLKCLHLPYHIEAPIEDIMKLDHLDEFYGCVKDASEFNILVRKTSLYNIVVSSDDTLYAIHICGSSMKDSFPESIYYGKGYITVKTDILQPLQLNAGAGQSKSVVENFAKMNAESLMVTNCKEIECIWRRDEGLVTTSIVASTSSPIAPNCIVFSSLTKLNIFDCKKMKKMGLKASELPNIESISITNGEAIEELLEAERGNGGEVTAMSIASLSKLTSLEIINCKKMKKLRLTASQLPSIKEIRIDNSAEIEELLDEDNVSGGEAARSSIVYLPKLTSLNIQNCKKMKKLRLTASQLPSIEKICIEHCAEIEELFEEDNASRGEAARSSIVSLPKLTRLDIIHCWKMKNLRLTVSQLPNIQKIRIEYCRAIEELFEEDSANVGDATEELLEAESGSRREDTTISFVSLPKLKMLSIHFCEKMKSISSGTTIACPSIAYIQLQRCPLLKKLPVIFGESNHGESPTPLALLKIFLRSAEKKWWEKMELEYPMDHGLLQPFLHFH